MDTLTTTFSNVPIGGTCTATIMDEPTRVERIAPVHHGAMVYNARRLDGKRGRTFVYAAAVVTVEQEQAALEQDYQDTLADFRAGAGQV